MLSKKEETMNTILIIANEIIRQTPKALLVSAAYDVWLPKSQATIIQEDTPTVIEIPTWLYIKHKHAFTLTTTAESMQQCRQTICNQ